MDTFDFKILQQLMTDARITWADLASAVGLSAPAVADRVNRLSKKGVIKKFGTILNPENIGLSCTAFIEIMLEKPQDRDEFIKKVMEMNEILECHHVVGDYDYLLKVRCRDTKHLDKLISFDLKILAGVVRTRTTIVMDTIKETEQLPLYRNIGEERKRS